MLLSRFWYLFLGLCAAGAAGAAMLGQGIINNRSDKQLQDRLHVDRQMAREVIRHEARTRIDRLAFAGVDTELGSLLRKARGVDDDRKLGEIAAETKKRLHAQVSDILAAAEGVSQAQRDALKPDIAFALDADGRIIAQLGPMSANPPGSSLATYPLVERAIRGYLRDDLWLYDRRVYRMAARPVVSGGQYVGAILHGYRLTPQFAAELSTVLGGAAVGFFHGTNVFALETGDTSTSQGELAAAIPGVLDDDDFKAQGRLDDVELQGGGRASFELMAGSAALAQVGFVVARPRTQLATPMALFESASKQDVEALPWPLLAGAAVIAAALGLLFMFLERDKPFKTLREKTAAVAAGELDQLIVTEWRGAYRALAMAINDAIEKEVHRAIEKGPRGKKKANLDELLGPAESAPDGFFGFASGGQSPSVPEPAPVAAPAPPGPPAAPSAAAPAPPPVAPPRAAPAPPPGPAASPPPPAPAPAAPAPDAPAADAAGDEDTHFRETYEQYVATRKECGEATESLTFEKFSVTLRKTRDQILGKHGGKSVRFTVYVKAGKAALKASPVK